MNVIGNLGYVVVCCNWVAALAIDGQITFGVITVVYSCMCACLPLPLSTLAQADLDAVMQTAAAAGDRVS